MVETKIILHKCFHCCIFAVEILFLYISIL
ncbi:hypothetical protein OIU76_017387 [Salix suchowensis]|nr:hypothetical protein OIU76_017387 [Salix suchowensis]